MRMAGRLELAPVGADAIRLLQHVHEGMDEYVALDPSTVWDVRAIEVDHHVNRGTP